MVQRSIAVAGDTGDTAGDSAEDSRILHMVAGWDRTFARYYDLGRTNSCAR